MDKIKNNKIEGVNLTYGFYLCPFCKEMTRLENYSTKNQILIGYCEGCAEKIEVRLFKPRYSAPSNYKMYKVDLDLYAEQNPAVTKSKGEQGVAKNGK